MLLLVLDLLKAVFSNPEWRSLQEKLFEYVTDYSQKVVYATGRLQF